MENLSTGYTWDEAPYHLKQAALHLYYALNIDKIEAYQMLLEKLTPNLKENLNEC